MYFTKEKTAHVLVRGLDAVRKLTPLTDGAKA